jgi:hypothetical protein
MILGQWQHVQVRACRAPFQTQVNAQGKKEMSNVCTTEHHSPQKISSSTQLTVVLYYYHAIAISYHSLLLLASIKKN